MSAACTIIDARRPPRLLDLAAIWESRELLGFLAWRDIRARYAQTLVGASWALIEPFVSVVAFTLIFNRVAGLESGHTPYPLYCFAATVVWIFFGRALRAVTTCYVVNAGLLRKVFFPRMVLPLAGVLATLVDFCCAFVMYFVLMAWYGLAPSLHLLTVPLWVALAACNALGIGLTLAAVNVRLRDVSQALPFLVQMGMFATPVAYPLATVPESWQAVYALNPLVGVVEAMRWALLPGHVFDPGLLVSTVFGAAGFMLLGAVCFDRAQRRLVDVL